MEEFTDDLFERMKWHCAVCEHCSGLIFCPEAEAMMEGKVLTLQVGKA